MALVNPAGGHGGQVGQESMLHSALGQRLDESLAVTLAGQAPVQADDTPRSVRVRIRRPKPWRKRKMASGREYWLKPSS